MDEELALAAEFPAASAADWRKLVDAALKGAPFDKKLVSQTYDGLRVDHPDPKAANAQALQDLENGANGLTLVFAGSLNANGYGLDASPEAIAQTLEGVDLDAGITIDFNLSPATRRAVDEVVALVAARKLDPAAVDLRPSLNPIGGFAALGSAPKPWTELAPGFAAAVRALADGGFKGPFVVADGRIVHNAGGSEAQELAFALATAVDSLRALEAGGVPLATARGMIYFRLAADADEFLGIAKFRAIRKLWARVEEACGLTPARTTVAAETAWRMLTKRDPYVNMLRTTIAVTAAGLGGADNIVALPHTLAIGLPDALARRVARNTQLILLEESNLYRVADPAAGSGGIEDLTEKLCQKAWGLFQQWDAAGGAWAALQKGLIQSDVAAVRAAREQAVARRKDALTGATDYPNLAEASATVLDVPRRPPDKADKATVEPLPSIRLAEPFEALRDRSDAVLKKTGARPRVFLANLGRLSDFTARATYAKNFYEAGGIEAQSDDGFKDRSEMVAAFKASGAKLACLCSSDTVYEVQAADAAKALAAAGATVHLAGRPGEHEAAWRAAGVENFIFVGCDALSTLRAVHDKLALK